MPECASLNIIIRAEQSRAEQSRAEQTYAQNSGREENSFSPSFTNSRYTTTKGMGGIRS